MRGNRIFWAVLILMVLNVAVLIFTKTGFGKTKDDYILSLKSSGWIIGESAFIIALAGIPGLNLLALILAVPIFFFDIWTKGIPLIQGLQTQSGQSTFNRNDGNQLFGQARNDWNTIIQNGKVNNSQ